jgi:hypothetical protein
MAEKPALTKKITATSTKQKLLVEQGRKGQAEKA